MEPVGGLPWFCKRSPECPHSPTCQKLLHPLFAPPCSSKISTFPGLCPVLSPHHQSSSPLFNTNKDPLVNDFFFQFSHYRIEFYCQFNSILCLPFYPFDIDRSETAGVTKPSIEQHYSEPAVRSFTRTTVLPRDGSIGLGVHSNSNWLSMSSFQSTSLFCYEYG